MRKSRMLFFLLIIGIFMIIASRMNKGQDAESNQVVAVRAADNTEPKVIVTSLQSTTSWNAHDVVRTPFELPLLYLHQNRHETAASERTLNIVFTGIDGGREIVVELLSQHENVETDMKYVDTQRFTLPDHRCDANNPCAVKWVANPHMTPSDFYYLQVKDSDGVILWPQEGADRPDFVMLDRWDVPVGDYKVRILYATLFPFARGQNDLPNRLNPSAVTDFIEEQFVPVIVDTWHTQFNTWSLGQPLHPEWDADSIIEIILTDGPYALWGNIGTKSQLIGTDNEPTKECRIWWSSSNNSFQAYRTLEDGVRAVYAHEFFHLVQRNILLFTDQPHQRWMKMFIEAQGKFAPSVQYPEMELRRYGVQPHLTSEYLDSANRFLTNRLNTSYGEMEADPIYKFDAACYWRFLYEQYGMMNITRIALIEMTNYYDTDIVQAIGVAMDNTFTQLDGPFTSFEESLVAFARANYALRQDEGRCANEDFTQCRGNYYDPSGQYAEPPLEAELMYTGSTLTYEGAIPASYGMDFIEINIEAVTAKKNLEVTLSAKGDISRFHTQAWLIEKGITHNHFLTADPVKLIDNGNSEQIFNLASVEGSRPLMLALIITRLDANEQLDPQGLYTITMRETDPFN